MVQLRRRIRSVLGGWNLGRKGGGEQCWVWGLTQQWPWDPSPLGHPLPCNWNGILWIWYCAELATLSIVLFCSQAWNAHGSFRTREGWDDHCADSWNFWTLLWEVGQCRLWVTYFKWVAWQQPESVTVQVSWREYSVGVFFSQGIRLGSFPKSVALIQESLCINPLGLLKEGMRW
jgi:hypothetical protein